ncbi:hypothetical protein JZ751_000024 [Albula glossodonta]|uniref:Uncharacterized protein n=1 Tax=Albula glossodonta TaxID=121402 RepID=A0A8T2PVD2_9TELE|nr:hypothetical protein JZ751_000024 [Albula glossodonta]
MDQRGPHYNTVHGPTEAKKGPGSLWLRGGGAQPASVGMCALLRDPVSLEPGSSYERERSTAKLRAYPSLQP